MANEVKMLPPNITVLWVPLVPGIADINAPTAEQLEFNLETPEEGAAYNITCAITQSDFTAQFTSRDTNNDKSLCDDSNVETPIYKNYEVSLTAFRDEDTPDDKPESVYNVFYELFRTPLQNGYIVTRVGKQNDEEFVDGDHVQIFLVRSGDPQNVHNEGEPIKMTVEFLPQGQSSNGYAIVGGGS